MIFDSERRRRLDRDRHADMRRGVKPGCYSSGEREADPVPAICTSLFRGRSGDPVKILWHDGLGRSLSAKRLDRGRFFRPSASDGSVCQRRRWPIC